MDGIMAITPKELKGISLSEIFWVDYKIDGRTKFVITSDLMRCWYYLYSVDRQLRCTKTKHKAKDPTELYKYCR